MFINYKAKFTNGMHFLALPIVIERVYHRPIGLVRERFQIFNNQIFIDDNQIIFQTYVGIPEEQRVNVSLTAPAFSGAVEDQFPLAWHSMRSLWVMNN